MFAEMIKKIHLKSGKRSNIVLYNKAINCMRYFLTRNNIKLKNVVGYNMAIQMWEHLKREIDFDRKGFRRYIIELYVSGKDPIINENNKDSKRTNMDSDMVRNKQRIYEAYLESDEWRQKRKRILGERGGKCERCHKDDNGLHLHHLTYDRLYDELDSDPMVLCRTCHKREHTIKLSKRFKAPNPFLKPKLEERRLVPINVNFKKACIIQFLYLHLRHGDNFNHRTDKRKIQICSGILGFF